ncbi:MAG: EpsG family protein [Ruminococcus sp.]|nr:EpsG family protein [Ruminococcus sp.]
MKVLLITALVAGIFAALASNQYIHTTNLQASNKSNKKNLTTYYVFVFLCVATLAVVSGLRYYVGTDFGGYYRGYPKWEMSFGERWRTWNEPGLSTIAKLLYPISQDGAAFILVIACLTVSLFVFTIAKNTDTFFFSTVIFICLSWVGCFNGVRQFLAAAILFAGHRLIFDRKFLKFCIVVFIAASFHITALIMLPMYFLITKVLDLKKIVFILVAGIATIYSYDFLFEILGVLKDSEAGSANTTYAQNSIHPLRILIAFAPIALYFFLLFQEKGFTGTENFYIGFIFVQAATILGTSNSAYLNRVHIYFTPFVCIGLSLLVQKFPKNQQFILKAFILVLYLIVWVYIDIKDINWMWVFNRDGAYINSYA